MKKETGLDIARAWKDPEYRQSLSASGSKDLPESPAGEYVLDDELLEKAVGGRRSSPPRAKDKEPESSGNVCTVSAECMGGTSCNPKDWF
jgi:mersacidin/lichenicidin family type 2 lantibiotic